MSWFILEPFNSKKGGSTWTKYVETWPQLAGKGWCLKITLYNICIKTYNGYIRGATIPSHVLEKLRIMTGKTIDYLLNLEPPAAGPGAGMQDSVWGGEKVPNEKNCLPLDLISRGRREREKTTPFIFRIHIWEKSNLVFTKIAVGFSFASLVISLITLLGR